MTDQRTAHVTTACAVLHTDGEGNVIPCPGYPHAEAEPGSPKETTGALPLGTDGQPFCVCEHERQKHFGDRLDCHGYDCSCKKYEPGPVAEQPELHDCPHCADAVVDLDVHLKTCRARQEEQLAEARRLLADEVEARASACQAEIQAVLDRYGMRLQISAPAVSIVPNP